MRERKKTLWSDLSFDRSISILGLILLIEGQRGLVQKNTNTQGSSPRGLIAPASHQFRTLFFYVPLALPLNCLFFEVRVPLCASYTHDWRRVDRLCKL